jgi:hypothetical protein
MYAGTASLDDFSFNAMRSPCILGMSVPNRKKRLHHEIPPAFLFCNEITLPEGEGYLCKEK